MPQSHTYLKCHECGEVLTNNAFFRDTTTASGRRQPCRACIRRREGIPGWRERARMRREAERLTREANRGTPPPPSKITNDDEPVSDWLRRRARVAEKEELHDTD